LLSFAPTYLPIRSLPAAGSQTAVAAAAQASAQRRIAPSLGMSLLQMPPQPPRRPLGSIFNNLIKSKGVL